MFLCTRRNPVRPDSYIFLPFASAIHHDEGSEGSCTTEEDSISMTEDISSPTSHGSEIESVNTLSLDKQYLFEMTHRLKTLAKSGITISGNRQPCFYTCESCEGQYTDILKGYRTYLFKSFEKIMGEIQISGNFCNMYCAMYKCFSRILCSNKDISINLNSKHSGILIGKSHTCLNHAREEEIKCSWSINHDSSDRKLLINIYGLEYTCSKTLEEGGCCCFYTILEEICKISHVYDVQLRRTIF